MRKGNQVYLTWSAPTLTTDGHNIRRKGAFEICGNVGAPIKACSAPVAKIPYVPPQKRSEREQMSYTDQIPGQIQAQMPGTEIFYAVRVVNSYGRSAELSNQVSIPIAPTLPAPTDFRARVIPEGVQLSWSQITPGIETADLKHAVRVFRREQNSGAALVAGEVSLSKGSAAVFLDNTLEWEKAYIYRATVVTYIAVAGGKQEQFEGEDTPEIMVFAHDVFPPAAPSGLQAVFSGPGQKPFIDLIWAANSETDLAGYNVYRRKAGAQPVKITPEPVKSPVYRDPDIQAGHEYLYSVSAVDARGNESTRSEEASESVPVP